MYPRATYRLQFNRHFGFKQAAELAPYLALLGISHVYASPYLKARPGSMHGYDIVDHGQLNPELGDAADFEHMLAAFHRHGLKQVLDIVPNHMGVGGADNPLWLDVLEWGSESPWAGWFDIDWEPDHRYLHGKLLVPMLGNQYGIELENGKLVLKYDDITGEFAVWAYDQHQLPICPLDYEIILGKQHPGLEYLGDDFSALGEWRPHSRRRADELKAQLATLIATDEAARRTLHGALERINAEFKSPVARPELHQLIQRQHWRATHFRVAGDDINYRRFFNINDLAGIRVELPDVFEASHRLIFQLLRSGAVDALRVDHIDGLLDPKSYLERLSEQALECIRSCDPQATRAYIVVEKILAQDEQLHGDWPVSGTTGYETGNLLIGMLIDPASAAQLTRCYQDCTGETAAFAEIVRLGKRRVMENEMVSELNVIARDAARVARQSPRTADFTKNVLLRAMREWIACFSVYRTYIDSNGILTAADRHYIELGLEQARRNESEIDPSVYDFLQQLLCGELIQQRAGFVRHKILRCAMKLQQYSGPVMAKGLEDTALYRFNRLLAVNDVGGHPDHLGHSIEAFHEVNLHRHLSWPHAMICTSTHDSKRGEDVRARLAVLSELPEEWTRCVSQWNAMINTYPMFTTGDALGIDRNDLYLLYQAMLGSWPTTLDLADDPADLQNFIARLKTVLVKSLREAKQRSSWTAPNIAYEKSLTTLVATLLTANCASDFRASFFTFQKKVARLGVANSLVVTALKLTLPGVPDIYQGAELWDLNMVDPDNRRAVDFSIRIDLLNRLQQRRAVTEIVQQGLEHWQDGAIKLAVIHCLLSLRRAHTELFDQGTYEPCLASGPDSDAVIAFMRRQGTHVLLVVISRYPARRQHRDWEDTTLQLPNDLHTHTWRDVLVDVQIKASGHLYAKDLFSTLPVAVLMSENK